MIFLSEAFTRPKLMKRLAKLGFTQSYTYFTWRNTKQELTEYLTELTRGRGAGILPAELLRQHARHQAVPAADERPRPASSVRLVLAATLAGNYGIYSGFELCEADAVPGKEEYLDSEKYELKAWDWDRPGNIRDDIRLHQSPAARAPCPAAVHEPELLQRLERRHPLFRQGTEDKRDFVLIAVNLDPASAQGATSNCRCGSSACRTMPPSPSRISSPAAASRGRGKVQHMLLDPHDGPM